MHLCPCDGGTDVYIFPKGQINTRNTFFDEMKEDEDHLKLYKGTRSPKGKFIIQCDCTPETHTMRGCQGNGPIDGYIKNVHRLAKPGKLRKTGGG